MGDRREIRRSSRGLFPIADSIHRWTIPAQAKMCVFVRMFRESKTWGEGGVGKFKFGHFTARCYVPVNPAFKF